MHEGSDAVLMSYSAVGLGWLMAMLRFPPIRVMIDLLYRCVASLFAAASSMLPHANYPRFALTACPDIPPPATPTPRHTNAPPHPTPKPMPTPMPRPGPHPTDRPKPHMVAGSFRVTVLPSLAGYPAAGTARSEDRARSVDRVGEKVGEKVWG